MGQAGSVLLAPNRVISVDGKRMTKSVFNQIEYLDEDDFKDILGYVKLKWCRYVIIGVNSKNELRSKLYYLEGVDHGDTVENVELLHEYFFSKNINQVFISI